MKKHSADERTVPAREGRAEVRERASRFLAFAYPVSNADEAAPAVARLKRQYHDATHVAFAWKIGVGDTAARRSSDAGFFSVDSSRCISTDVLIFVGEEILVSANKFWGTFRSLW